MLGAGWSRTGPETPERKAIVALGVGLQQILYCPQALRERTSAAPHDHDRLATKLWIIALFYRSVEGVHIDMHDLGKGRELFSATTCWALDACGLPHKLKLDQQVISNLHARQ
jgi:hypothetical protein